MEDICNFEKRNVCEIHLHISVFFRTFAENYKLSIMTPRITLVKSYRNKVTLRLLELQEVADFIRSGEYDRQRRC